jgi:hypothetical protein
VERGSFPARIRKFTNGPVGRCGEMVFFCQDKEIYHRTDRQMQRGGFICQDKEIYLITDRQMQRESYFCQDKGVYQRTGKRMWERGACVSG